MEEGSLRCDANISIRSVGSSELGTKVEIKNMNSIRSMERALAFERERQVAALEVGEALVQETRHWDEDSGTTKSMRSKEEAFDYRYFPEPDIPPLEPGPDWVEKIRAELPELPRARRARYESDLGLKPDVARVLVANRDSTDLFERTIALGADPKAVANWITQDLAALWNEAGVDESKVGPQHVADLIAALAEGTLGGDGAKQALEEAFTTGDPIEEIVERLGLRQVSDVDSLGVLADQVIAENPDPAEKFRAGKEGVLGFLVGQLKKKAPAADAKVAQELLRQRLSG
jgi:aspartyl-tRNA(Asn)/glutamyl-tRNA(Gln) amidotransferase subunit B